MASTGRPTAVPLARRPASARATEAGARPAWRGRRLWRSLACCSDCVRGSAARSRRIQTMPVRRSMSPAAGPTTSSARARPPCRSPGDHGSGECPVSAKPSPITAWFDVVPLNGQKVVVQHIGFEPGRLGQPWSMLEGRPPRRTRRGRHRQGSGRTARAGRGRHDRAGRTLPADRRADERDGLMDGADHLHDEGVGGSAAPAPRLRDLLPRSGRRRCGGNAAAAPRECVPDPQRADTTSRSRQTTGT